MNRPADPQAGFLLADTLVTLTISAFVLLGLTGLSAVLLRTADRSAMAIQTAEDLDRTLASLSRLIEKTARARFSGTEPQSFLFNGDGERLMFATSRSGAQGGGRLEVVAFRSDPDGRLMLAEAAFPASAAAPGDLPFGPARAAYAGPARLRFSYLGPPDATGKANWLPVWPIGMHMPEAVAVEVVDASGRALRPRLEVSLLSNTDIGCLSGGFCGRQGGGAAPSAAGSGASAAIPGSGR